MMRVSRFHSNFIWIQFSIILLVLLLSYWETIGLLIEQWLKNDDFSHGLLVLPISAYLIWDRRHSINMDTIMPDWKALPVLFAALFLYITGELGAELFLIRLSMLLFFTVAIWFLFGMRLFRTLCFPLLFLFMMLPLPGVIYKRLTFPLQLLSSEWSVNLLNIFGVLAYREGNVIDLGFTKLQVVEACNGLRFILPLLTLGVLFAFYKQNPLWKRLVLIISTIPIAISANVLRISGTGVLSKYWGEEAAQGFFHGFSGWVVFMISFGLFFGLNWLLRQIPIKKKPLPEIVDNKEKLQSYDSNQSLLSMYSPIVIFAGLILLAPLVVSSLEDIAPKTLKQSLQNFPLVIGDRSGQIQTMDDEMWEKVGGQQYFMGVYSYESEAPISFYTAYYEHQRKPGAYVHSPKYCLPGGGWFIQSSRSRTILSDNEDDMIKTLPVNELIIQKDEGRELVYFWYQGRGRVVTSEWMAKVWTVLDGIFRRRTDGALVRVISPLHSKEDLDHQRTLLDRFAIEASNILDRDFFP